MRATLESLIHRDHTTMRWSGGTTTELAIYPVSANYKQGNYLWRLSTATVEVETSLFSALPGITRTLMLLDGNMVLRHAGHHEARLRPFDQDQFDGGWTTHSQGRGRDFNLMCAAGVQGDLAAVPIDGRDARCEAWSGEPASWIAWYSVDGDVTICTPGEKATLRCGAILVAAGAWLSHEPELVIENPTDQKTVIIRCTIRLTGQSPP